VPTARLDVNRRFNACLGLWLLGCGSAEHAVIPEPVEAGSDQAEVSSRVNVCPLFTGSLVMPQRIALGETSEIMVRVTDPDAPDSQLVLAWSASSGTFSASDNRMTTYRCGEPGTQQLTCTAKDKPGCVSSLNIDVECVSD
jgi:hypothetical protein